MNPNEEENNNPLNNSADTPAPTSEEPTTTSEEPTLDPTSEPATEPTPTPEPTPAPEAPTPAEPIATATPQKKSATLTVILLIIAAVLVIVGIVVAIMLFSGGNNNGSNNEDIAEGSSTILVCNASVDKDKASQLGVEGLVSYSSEFDAYYDSSDTLTGVEFSSDYNFSTDETASAYIADQETAYNKVLENLGLSSDPFNSSFEVSEGVASIYRSAEADILNDQNASIFNLIVKEDGTVDTSKSGIEEAYNSISNLNYNCFIQDEEEE